MSIQSNPVNNAQSPSARPTPSAMDVLIIIWIGYTLFSFIIANSTKSIPYSQFLSELDKGNITEINVTDRQLSGTMRGVNGKKEAFTSMRVDPALAEKLESHHVVFSELQTNDLWTVIPWLVAGAIAVVALGQLLGHTATNRGRILSPFALERNKARIFSEENIKVTFADVAGVDEAKQELQEVVRFLKNPAQYGRLGGRLPKGVLLIGPPGTGKTLLARAVAGEANVPFFSISGSEFVELFVGVGAARVRDLFAEARQKAPSIIFIDELDALGRSRSSNPILSQDEKEQTLNQLLVEMDGFDTQTGVILLAATNRPEILDQALLRAGRFDRQVPVDRPDRKGRSDILRVHIKKIIAAENLDLEAIAALTSGFTGADLANVVNEAALLASRRSSDSVLQSDFETAIERTVAGLEKKSRILTSAEQKLVAYHESGHALVGMSFPNTDKIQKVSIIPHGIAALGYTVKSPLEDRFILSRTELQNKLTTMLGGRAAELLMLGESSTGAADDLARATELARAMVIRYGMDAQLGLATYEADSSAFLQESIEQHMYRGVSSETACQIDQTVNKLLNEALTQAIEILKSNQNWLIATANKLIQEETLTGEQIRSLMPRQKGSPIHTLNFSATKELSDSKRSIHP